MPWGPSLLECISPRAHESPAGVRAVYRARHANGPRRGPVRGSQQHPAPSRTRIDIGVVRMPLLALPTSRGVADATFGPKARTLLGRGRAEPPSRRRDSQGSDDGTILRTATTSMLDPRSLAGSGSHPPAEGPSRSTTSAHRDPADPGVSPERGPAILEPTGDPGFRAFCRWPLRQALLLGLGAEEAVLAHLVEERRTVDHQDRVVSGTNPLDLRSVRASRVVSGTNPLDLRSVRARGGVRTRVEHRGRRGSQSRSCGVWNESARFAVGSGAGVWNESARLPVGSCHRPFSGPLGALAGWIRSRHPAPGVSPSRAGQRVALGGRCGLGRRWRGRIRAGACVRTRVEPRGCRSSQSRAID